jgi:RHS repeat-associated protein
VSQIWFTNNGALRMTTSKYFDFLNRLTQISSVPSASSAVSFSYAYNSANQRTGLTNADNSKWAFGYDNLGQVTSGKKYWADGPYVAGEQFTYAFDDIGNRTSTARGGDQTGSNLRSASYYANSLNQYTNRTVPAYVDILGSANSNANVMVESRWGPAPWNTWYGMAYRKGEFFRAESPLDNSGSAIWMAVTNIAVLPGATSADIQTNATGGVFVPRTPEQFTYDADGNLATDGHWTYSWDAENRLVKLVANLYGAPVQTIRFEYDWQGRRTHKQVWPNSTGNSTPTNDVKFLYDGWNLMGQLSSTNTVIQTYLWGLDLSGTDQGAGGVGGLLAVNDATNGAHFAAFDGNGNLAALAKATDGTASANHEYGPFGELLRATGPMAKVNPFRFSTKYQDAESDLLYYGSRYYNPSTGSWLNRDTAEELGGPLYRLLSNDPNNDADYLGQVGVKDIKGLITDSVTDSAEAIFNFLQNHPPKASEVSLLNKLLPPLKKRAASVFDIKTKTMSWRDIIFDWFFELGTTPFEFVDGDKTTEQLKNHEGVNEARALAKKDCEQGKHTTEKTWTYGVDQFYHSISHADSIAIALGSYSITVKSSADCKEYEFSVQNDSTWESATRFRKAPTPGGQHQAILSDRVRNGPGIQLGGNMHEHWTWKEICN